MAGFPTRISRALFGPKRQDLYKAKDEKNFISAWFFELLFWQVSGLNQSAPLASGLIDNGGALLAHEESWAPDGGTAPGIAHPATGHFQLTYAGTYTDEEDQDVPVALTRARGFAQSSSARTVSGIAAANVVDIYVFDEVGDPVDDTVWFEAF